MGLNKWLCRNFDKKNKGYVTIEDIFFGLLKPSIIVAIVIGIVYAVYKGVLLLLSGDIANATPDTYIDFVSILGLAFLIFIALVLGVVVCIYISEIKVAQCPLKEKR